ncbi:MAG: 5'/3'-nucleotidase SurE [bacterium]
MHILVTNDDGIHSPGLVALVAALRNLGEVTVVAPETERSAAGHSITINHPLRIHEVIKGDEAFGYAVNGTPADCVKIALGTIMKERADLVVAGINTGLNTGTHVIYSGTVSGAMEGAILGLPALAISVEVKPHAGEKALPHAVFSFPAEFSAYLAGMVMERGLPHQTLLNINFPACSKSDIQGIAITQQGQSIFRDRFHKRIDPREKVYYWLAGDIEEIASEGGDSLDYIAVKRGYISITPLSTDLTNHHYIDQLKGWNISLER